MELTPQQFAERKAITLAVFKAFAAYCRQHHLRYYAAYGTALGAIRHQGFIPWDDDIDVYMPRPDYDRLLRSYAQQPCEGYDLLTPDTTPDYHLTFAKFSLHESTLVEAKHHPCNIGLFVDIFPLDYVDKDLHVVRQKVKQVYRLCTRFTSATGRFSCTDLLQLLFKGDVKGFLSLSLLQIGRESKRTQYLQELNKVLAAAPNNEADSVMNYHYPLYEDERIPKTWLHDTMEIPFEDTTICVFKEVHEYLTRMYGDYMSPPPVEQQVSHHTAYRYHPSQRL